MPQDKLNRKEIELRVKQVISKTAGIKEEKLTHNSHLRDDLGIDSFSAIEMIYNAEAEFDISISDEELAKVATVDDIVKIVQGKLNKQ